MSANFFKIKPIDIETTALDRYTLRKALEEYIRQWTRVMARASTPRAIDNCSRNIAKAKELIKTLEAVDS